MCSPGEHRLGPKLSAAGSAADLDGRGQMAKAERDACKLCLFDGCASAGRNKHREFVHCPSCGLVFVPTEYWTTAPDERARYARHDNTENNPGYVRFLGETANVVASMAKPGARILDFGAGENAVLTGLLRRQGHDCTAYDPLYGLGTAALSERYDVVVICEVIEHLRELREELLVLGKCVRPNGGIVVRTQCYPSLTELPTWWYARDATHINFFAPQTLVFAAGLRGMTCETTAHPDLTVWRKQG